MIQTSQKQVFHPIISCSHQTAKKGALPLFSWKPLTLPEKWPIFIWKKGNRTGIIKFQGEFVDTPKILGYGGKAVPQKQQVIWKAVDKAV